MDGIEQGEILSVERISTPVLAVSKKFFNRTEQIIACPVLKNASSDPLHILIRTKEMQGVVLCEQVRILDLHVRGYKKIDELRPEDIMNVADAIQSIFDYYPFGK
ncbi:MAG TPA: type II toxin-antitoxin system PemK/MazF family toxin [Lachnospiraceae bacterium]|nr:type II toxin-antitoxin system PemK/MazF family toxin [Lachnospiraceae bacterium]